MKFFDTMSEKWNAFWKKTKPFRNTMKKTGKLIYQLRDVFLGLPVVIGAVWLAFMNFAKLPDEVGINLQASGEFSSTVGKGIAVLCPLLLTVICLVLMVLSKRKLYPWMISLLTLLVPVLLLVTNVYPA